MISCILISHGPLAGAMIKSVETVIGNKNRMYAVELEVGESADNFVRKLESVLRLFLQFGEVIVVSDFLLGTPFNAAVQLSEHYRFEHVTGMSAPILLAILKECDEKIGAQELCTRALNEAVNQTMDVNRFIKEMID